MGAHPNATTPAKTVAVAPIAMVCSLVGAIAVVVTGWVKQGECEINAESIW